MKRLVVLLVVVIVLFVAAAALGARGQEGGVDTEDQDFLEAVRDLGGKQRLEPDDITAPCFNRDLRRFTAPCTVTVPDKVRRIVLVSEAGTVAATMRAAPTDEYLAQDESAGPGATIELDAFGDGGTLTVGCAPATTCRARLD